MNPTDEQLVRWGAGMLGWTWEPEDGCYRVPHDDGDDFQDPEIDDLNFAVQVAEAGCAAGELAGYRIEHSRVFVWANPEHPYFEMVRRHSSHARALLTALYRLHEEMNHAE